MHYKDISSNQVFPDANVIFSPSISWGILVLFSFFRNKPSQNTNFFRMTDRSETERVLHSLFTLTTLGSCQDPAYPNVLIEPITRFQKFVSHLLLGGREVGCTIDGQSHRFDSLK